MFMYEVKIFQQNKIRFSRTSPFLCLQKFMYEVKKFQEKKIRFNQTSPFLCLQKFVYEVKKFPEKKNLTKQDLFLPFQKLFYEFNIKRSDSIKLCLFQRLQKFMYQF